MFSRRPWCNEEVKGKKKYGQIIRPAAFLTQSFPGNMGLGMKDKKHCRYCITHSDPRDCVLELWH